MRPYRQRIYAGIFVGQVVVGLLLWLVFYRDWGPLPPSVTQPLYVLAALALVFGPVLIGNYFAGRKGKPPLS